MKRWGLVFICMVFLGCSKSAQRTPQSTYVSQKFESYIPDPFVVRMKSLKNESGVLAALQIGIKGKEGVSEIFLEKQDQMQNLLISVLANYSFSNIKSERGKMKFQEEALEVFENFIEKDKILKVDLVEVREI